MSELMIWENTRLPAMTPAAIDAVRLFQAAEAQETQVALETRQDLNIEAGLYVRTVWLPGRVRMTGALIKIPTTVIVDGDTFVWLGDRSRRLTGYTVLQGSAGRQQVFEAVLDTVITMIFPTDAKTIAEAEREFTDDFEMLASRREDAHNLTPSPS